MTQLLAMTFALILHVQTIPSPPSKNLDPTTRPLLLPKEFGKLACISVSEFPINKAMKPPQNYLIRVFRYTSQGDFQKGRLKIEEALRKQGWKVDAGSRTNAMSILDKMPKHPKVRRQGIILSTGKYVRDANSPVKTRKEDIPGWFRISYNEEYRSRPAG